MRLIDADALIESICQEECERHYSDCDYNCSSVAPVINAPTIEAVPLKPLAKWIAGYAFPPGLKAREIVNNRGRDIHEIATEGWEDFLRGMDWRADE